MASSFRQSWLAVVGWALIAVLTIAATSYFYLGSKTEYFTRHKLRLLALMSDQLKDSVEILTQKRLPSAFTKQDGSDSCELSGFLDEKQKLNIYLGDNFQVLDQRLSPMGNGSGITTVDVKASQDNDDLTLRVAYEGRSGRCWADLTGKGNFKFFLANYREAEFDEILVANADGQVVFQKWISIDPPGLYETRRVTKPSRGAVTVLNLFSPPDLSSDKPKDKAAGEETSNSSGEPGARGLEHSEIRDVRLAGEPYKLFMQPVRISLYEPGVHTVKDGKFTADWIVAGLIHADRFRGESLKMSHTVVLIFFTTFVVIILSTPFVKVKYLGPRHALQSSTILALALSLVLLSAVIGLSGFDLYAYPRLERLLDGQLKTISDQVQQHFHTELSQICAMMSAIAEQDRQNLPTVETDLLKEDMKYRYPYIDPTLYFSSVIWLNKEGQQEKKWTIMDRRTPFFNLVERTYFKNARDGKTWNKLIKSDSGEKTAEFWLEPVQSVATGQSEAITAMPLRDSQSSGPYPVLSMIPNLISVRGTSDRGGPVLPATFGFMLVENNGSVLFHSSGTYTDENLIEECDGNRELLATLSSRAREFMSVVYLGRNHRFYVTPLEGLPWSLVVYRDQELLNVANLEIVMVSIVLFVIYVSVVLWPLGLALFWRTSALWPQLRTFRDDVHSHRDEANGEAPRYQALALFCGLLAVFYIFAMKNFTPHQLWYSALALTLFTLGLAYAILGGPSELPRWRRWMRYFAPLAGAGVLIVWMVRHHDFSAPLLVLAISAVAARVALRFPVRRSRPSSRLSYLLAMGGLLLVTSVLPALMFFSLAYQAEMKRYVRYDQISFLYSLLSRRDHVEDLYRDIKKPDDFVHRRLKSDLDIYGTSLVHANYNRDPWESDFLKIPLNALPSTYVPSDCLERERFQSLLLDTRPLYNTVAALNHELTHDASGDCAMLWRTEQSHHLSDSQMMLVAKLDHGNTIEVISDVPGFLAPDDLEWWILSICAVGLGLFLVFVSVEFFCRHVFLLDLDKSLITRPPFASRPPIEKDTLVLGVSSGSDTWFKNDIENVHFVDLGVLLREQTPGQPIQLDLPSDRSKKIVVLDHLDYGVSDPEMNRRKVDVLEKLLDAGYLVVALSVVDPMDFDFEVEDVHSKREAGITAQYRDRWAQLLSRFSKRYVNVGATRDVIDQLLRKADRHGSSDDARRTLVREVKGCAYLAEIANEVLDLEDATEFDRRRFLSEVGDRANAYYRTLWDASSRDEKFVLFDLAQDSFLNSQYPNLNSLLRSLLGRGLVEFDPSPRLMNDSFKQFVREAGRAEGLAEILQREGGNPWRTLRWMLLTVVVCGSVLLFFTQRNLFENITLFVGAAAGGLAAFFKMLDLFRTGKSTA